MRLKVQSDESGSLCTTCRNGMRVESRTRVTYGCSWMHDYHRIVQEPVLKCSAYDNRNIPSQWEMEKIAWNLRTDKSGRILGFRAPKKEEDF